MLEQVPPIHDPFTSQCDPPKKINNTPESCALVVFLAVGVSLLLGTPLADNLRCVCV